VASAPHGSLLLLRMVAPIAARTDMRPPALSLILCSRNDRYMGDSLWRLQTALNYVAQNVRELGREADVEVLVTDWGSGEPLRDVLELSPAATRMTSFVLVPPAIARELQHDSPFPEVIALNAAARRATGEYIGRIDQDTLVGQRFLRTFFDIHEGRSRLSPTLAMGFSTVKMVSFRFAVRCPAPSSVALFVRWFGRYLSTERERSHLPFYALGVGIWLLHRDLWYESGGYDERMIYMNGMEPNMIRRLMPKHDMVDLGELTEHDFYHLEHYHPWSPRRSSSHRRVNPHLPFSQPEAVNPNGEGWGLSRHDLQVLPARGHPGAPTTRAPATALLAFLLEIIRIAPIVTLDRVGLSLRQQVTTWRLRLRTARRTVAGHPVLAWPGLLRTRWGERRRVQGGDARPAAE
jgi:hypothetical protein